MELFLGKWMQAERCKLCQAGLKVCPRCKNTFAKASADKVCSSCSPQQGQEGPAKPVDDYMRSGFGYRLVAGFARWRISGGG